jgi:tRNA threonylcarbamoyladenosine biosynthesis protein TsaB
MVLAIETSGTVGSVALGRGETILGSACFDTRQEAVRRLPPAVEELLEKNGGADALTGLAVSNGPGSFNGLRVGVALAKAMAHALRRPVVGIPTPQVWATETMARFPRRPVAVLQPSRRGHVYLTLCGPDSGQRDRAAILGGPEVVEIDNLTEALAPVVPGKQTAPLVLTGDWLDLEAWAADRQGLICDTGRGLSPAAVTVAHLARWLLDRDVKDSYYILRPAYVSVSQAERNWGVNLGL